MFFCSLSLLARTLICVFHLKKPSSKRRKVLPNCLHIFWVEIKHILRNTLKFLNLPTSQYSYDDMHVIYQSLFCFKNIKLFMLEVVLYFFFMMYNIFLMGIEHHNNAGLKESSPLNSTIYCLHSKKELCNLHQLWMVSLLFLSLVLLQT